MNNYERFCYTYNEWVTAKRNGRGWDAIEKRWAEYCLARDLYHGWVRLPELVIKNVFGDESTVETFI